MTPRSTPITAGPGLVLEPPVGRDPGADVLGAALAAADLVAARGWGSLWVGEPTVEPPARVPYEPYSLLGALAARSSGVDLGVAAGRDRRRAPSILAKLVTAVDVVSHGRGVLGLDGDPDRPADADRLAEALEVARAVLEDDRPTFAGRIYHVDGAVNRPAPVRPGGVPLVVFLPGAGPGLTGLVAVCDRSADAVVVGGGPEVVAGVSALLGTAGPARSRRGDRPALLALVGGDAATGAVADLRGAGADGCLVGVPAPWGEAALSRAGHLAGADAAFGR
jgi:alkanesulfonate monooxygenase SsuD/methylene tetrahydromethanopterin reductase-like flavin-dependent oxidoreductase (luciferase family)